MQTLTPSFNRNKAAYGTIIHPCGSGTIRDESPHKRTVTPQGGGAIENVGRFGKQLKCRNATSDYYQVSYSSSAHDLGTDPFSISMWYHCYDRDYISFLVCQFAGASDVLYLSKDNNAGGNKLHFRCYTGAPTEKARYVTENVAMSNGGDYFLEFTRSGADFYIFVDGIRHALTTTTAVGANSLTVGAGWQIGMCNTDVRYGEFGISEFCVLKGRAWHTSNYTRPTRRQ